MSIAKLLNSMGNAHRGADTKPSITLTSGLNNIRLTNITTVDGQLEVYYSKDGQRQKESYSDAVGKDLHLVADANTTVTLIGTIIHLNCYNMELKHLDVSKCKSLELLSCNDNSLWELNMLGLTNIRHLQCYNNPFLDEPMESEDFVKNLPTFTSGSHYLKIDGSYASNIAEVATAKGWEVEIY